MATITIRNLSPEIVENLKTLAARNGRSMEQEAREILAYRLASRSSILDAIQAKWEEHAPPSAQEIQDWITAGRRGRE